MLTLGLTGCGEVKEPVKTDYKAQSITITSQKNQTYNVSNDEIRVPANMGSRTILLGSPYGKHNDCYPIMNERVRALSERILQDQNELAYEIDKQLYSIKKSKNTTQ